MSLTTGGLMQLEQSGVLRRQVALADYTTWRVGGPAEWLAEPADIHQLQELLQWAQIESLPIRVIGAGSNLLISDRGLPGLTLCLRKLQGSQVCGDSGEVSAWAGEPIPTLARRAAKAGLHGLEWAVGIPGTVGGAAVMNAGAQGGCTAERLISVDVLDLQGTSSEPITLTSEVLDFAYRHSRLQRAEHLVIAARFLLEPGHDPAELSRRTSDNLSHRTTTQPYQWPSCGSVFRNPEPLKAGQLIESLGLSRPSGWGRRGLQHPRQFHRESRRSDRCRHRQSDRAGANRGRTGPRNPTAHRSEAPRLQRDSLALTA